MKKILATLGSFLIFAGLKAQIDTIKKETTPLVKPKVQNVSTTNTTLSSKQISSKTAMVKTSTIESKSVKIDSKQAVIKQTPIVKK